MVGYLGAAALIAAFLVVRPVHAQSAALAPLGQADPGTVGFNTMAVGLDGYAYLGSWGSQHGCPALGVRIFDLHDPTAPTVLGSAAAYPGTTAEHVAAVHLSTAAYNGSLLLTGIQRCAPASASPSGLAVWDVTNPAAPRELAFYDTGRAGIGVHEFAVDQHGGHLYAYLAVPDSEAMGGPGDLRILDLGDPTHPTLLSDWGAGRDAGLPVGRGGECAVACRGSVPHAFLHSVAPAPDGRTVYLSYWDLGMLILDVSDPRAPALRGRFVEPDTAEGNTHSVAVTPDGNLALVADEMPWAPWGFLHLVDVHDAVHPSEVGSFQTAHAAAGAQGGPFAYTIHNPLIDDHDPGRCFLAWYADGVRWLDIADPTHPVELQSWVPPHDPMVWSVQIMGDLLLVGDINNGLYVLRRPD
jgi:hypothetical protein